MNLLKYAISFLFVTNLFAQDWFIQPGGDDANSPCDGGWSDACQTYGSMNGNMIAGDTSAVGSGTITEAWNPTDDGSSGNWITVIDSATYANIGSWDLTTIDTTKVWLAHHQGTGTISIGFSGDDWWELLGLWISNGNTDVVNAFNSDGLKIQHCKIADQGDGSGQLLDFDGTSQNDTVQVNYFRHDGGGLTYGIHFTTTGSNIYFVNNTIYVDGSTAVIGIESDQSASVTFKDNIIHQISTTAGDLAISVANTGWVGEVNYNLWYAPNVTNTWEFNGNTFDVLATWKDSLDNYEASAANELNADPDLRATATTGYSVASSPQDGTGDNALGFDEIGYWNLPSAPTSSPGQRGKFIRSRRWGYLEPRPICEKYHNEFLLAKL